MCIGGGGGTSKSIGEGGGGGGDFSHNTVRHVKPFSVSNSVKQHLNIRLPEIKDVSIIDKVAQIVFPMTFLIFNCIYWAYYQYYR